MKGIAEYVKDILVGKAVGVFGGNGRGDWSINIDMMPPSPDLAIAIFDRVPAVESKIMERNIEPGRMKILSIQVRGRSYRSVQTKAQEIDDALDRIGRLIPPASDVVITDILTSGDSVSLGMDETKRHLRTQDFRVFYKQNDKT